MQVCDTETIHRACDHHQGLKLLKPFGAFRWLLSHFPASQIQRFLPKNRKCSGNEYASKNWHSSVCTSSLFGGLHQNEVVAGHGSSLSVDVVGKYNQTIVHARCDAICHIASPLNFCHYIWYCCRGTILVAGPGARW